MENSCSPYADIAHEVPLGSILSPLPFNINICNMCFKKYKCDTFFLYQHLHIKRKNLLSPGTNIYVVIYLGK